MIAAIFKLKVQNVAFFAVAPSLMARYSYSSDISDRVDNLWRIHENRQKKGLGGTKQATGLYDADSHTGDRAWKINTGLQVNFDSLVSGVIRKPTFDNPFTRFNETIEEYPDQQGNLNDHMMYKTDNFERLKPVMPKEGSTVGVTTLIPTVDTDEKLIYYDTQGESLYTNPPDPNYPTVDHGLDEDKIWNFRKTTYNQDVVNNPWAKDAWQAMLEHSSLPWWGQKLAAPSFYKREKFERFMKQRDIRIRFDILLMKQAKEQRKGDMLQRDAHKAEVDKFLTEAKQEMLEYEMGEVYITDHKAAPKQYSTLTDEEDLEYYAYSKALEDYNKQPLGSGVSTTQKPKYEVGSMRQRMFDPLAGATKQPNGTLFYELTEKEIAFQLGEDRLRAQYDAMKELNSMDAEDDDGVRAALFEQIDEAGFSTAEWDQILSKEFNTFEAGEKYSYSKDLARTFKQQLATPTEAKMFKTLPKHVFMDIKKPRTEKGLERMYINPYNPSRKYPFESFFDMRRHEDWMESRRTQRNIGCDISRYTKDY